MTTPAMLRHCIAERAMAWTSIPVYRTAPSVLSPPCAYVKPVSGFRRTVGAAGIREYNFMLVVVASTADDQSGQDTLDAMLEASGTHSMLAPFDDRDALGLPDVSISCDGWSEYGTDKFGELDYLTAYVELSVLAPAR